VHSNNDVHGVHSTDDVHGVHSTDDVHGVHSTDDVHGVYSKDARHDIMHCCINLHYLVIATIVHDIHTRNVCYMCASDAAPMLTT
jgi:hypothetical protein